MIMTAETASSFFCPYMSAGQNTKLCVGDECMAWTLWRDDKGYCALIFPTTAEITYSSASSEER